MWQSQAFTGCSACESRPLHAKSLGAQYYDNAYSRALSDPKDLTCKVAGVNVVFDETIENNDATLFSGEAAGAALPTAYVTMLHT